MPCVDKVTEPYDNQIELTTFFRERTCKLVQFDREHSNRVKSLFVEFLSFLMRLSQSVVL